MRLFRRLTRTTTGEPRGEDGQTAAAVDGEPDTIAGERTITSVNRAASLQTRLSNLLALALVRSLAVGFLGWYYTRILSARTQPEKTARAARESTAQGEMKLPPLGRVEPRPPAAASLIDRALGGPPPAPPLPQGPSSLVARGDGAPPPGGKSKAELALERRLSGPVFSGPTNSAPAPAPASDARGVQAPVGSTPVDHREGAGEIAGLLRPAVTPAALAQVLPTQRLLLPKGAFLDCTLETAIDSTLPGMTTCVLATDTFGVDGSVVLLERGTKLVGETRGQVRQGTARIFVLWTEARTPTGVIVPLASPGTDELGRSGLPGEVDRHFWDRFGAAILVSVIDGAVQAAVASRSTNGGALIVNPSGSRDVMTEVLRSTIDIPPTVTKANGDRIQVFVARDLDFRSVYELRAGER